MHITTLGLLSDYPGFQQCDNRSPAPRVYPLTRCEASAAVTMCRGRRGSPLGRGEGVTDGGREDTVTPPTVSSRSPYDLQNRHTVTVTSSRHGCRPSSQHTQARPAPTGTGHTPVARMASNGGPFVWRGSALDANASEMLQNGVVLASHRVHLSGHPISY